ncbi:hypothetical protein BH11BAC5_BH11BAC5_55380 [soil metagenome]
MISPRKITKVDCYSIHKLFILLKDQLFLNKPVYTTGIKNQLRNTCILSLQLQ